MVKVKKTQPKKKKSIGAVVFAIVLIIITMIFAMAMGGAMLLQKFMLQVALGFVVSIVATFGIKAFILKKIHKKFNMPKMKR